MAYYVMWSYHCAVGNYGAVRNGELSVVKCQSRYREYSYRNREVSVLGSVKMDHCVKKISVNQISQWFHEFSVESKLWQIFQQWRSFWKVSMFLKDSIFYGLNSSRDRRDGTNRNGFKIRLHLQSVRDQSGVVEPTFYIKMMEWHFYCFCLWLISLWLDWSL